MGDSKLVLSIVSSNFVSSLFVLAFFLRSIFCFLFRLATTPLDLTGATKSDHIVGYFACTDGTMPFWRKQAC